MELRSPDRAREVERPNPGHGRQPHPWTPRDGEWRRPALGGPLAPKSPSRGGAGGGGVRAGLGGRGSGQPSYLGTVPSAEETGGEVPRPRAAARATAVSSAPLFPFPVDPRPSGCGRERAREPGSSPARHLLRPLWKRRLAPPLPPPGPRARPRPAPPSPVTPPPRLGPAPPLPRRPLLTAVAILTLSTAFPPRSGLALGFLPLPLASLSPSLQVTCSSGSQASSPAPPAC
ncbi:basic proline-rich protein-like [Trichosurus vulpecula]|uniref:basic proline-rich protein-like n=1 Tax=Trichosurus vulpecula TaxID=9337 RepID=UPI00186ADB6A|nr:basic proline-rich protein-like [Trichosurus vulpecula]